MTSASRRPAGARGGELTTTEISVAGANCPWCFNETIDLLRREPGVVSVDATIAGQCLRVVHRDVAIERLVTGVRAPPHAADTYYRSNVLHAVAGRAADLNCLHRHATGPGATS
jgi:hypothetical protein